MSGIYEYQNGYEPEPEWAPTPCRHRRAWIAATHADGKVWREYVCPVCHRRGVQRFGATGIDWEGERLAKRAERLA